MNPPLLQKLNIKEILTTSVVKYVKRRLKKTPRSIWEQRKRDAVKKLGSGAGVSCPGKEVLWRKQE